MQNSPRTYTAISSTPATPVRSTDTMVISAVISALPIVVIFTVLGYRRYRAMIMRQRIQWLNRIWQLDCTTELS